MISFSTPRTVLMSGYCMVFWGSDLTGIYFGLYAYLLDFELNSRHLIANIMSLLISRPLSMLAKARVARHAARLFHQSLSRTLLSLPLRDYYGPDIAYIFLFTSSSQRSHHIMMLFFCRFFSPRAAWRAMHPEFRLSAVEIFITTIATIYNFCVDMRQKMSGEPCRQTVPANIV